MVGFTRVLLVAAAQCLCTLAATPCELSHQPGLCGADSDDTAVLQAALDKCPLEGRSVVIQHGAECTTQPLKIRGNTDLVTRYTYAS